jgi:glycopeptide antibiotics resistance protein
MAIYFFPLPMLLGLGLLAIILLIFGRTKHSAGYRLTFSIFWLYLMLVAALTIFPLFFPLEGESRRSIGDILARVNLVPFYQMPSARLPFRLRGEMVANILMTIPFGLLLPLLARIKAWVFPLLAVGFGLTIELTQLGLNIYSGDRFRVADINDVIFNFTGAMIGYAIYLLTRGVIVVSRRLQQRSR